MRYQDLPSSQDNNALNLYSYELHGWNLYSTYLFAITLSFINKLTSIEQDSFFANKKCKCGQIVQQNYECLTNRTVGECDLPFERWPYVMIINLRPNKYTGKCCVPN